MFTENDEYKDILSITKDIISKQRDLLKEKQAFHSLEEEATKIFDSISNGQTKKECRGLLNHIKTWIKVLDLWVELQDKLDDRVEELRSLTKKSEECGYMEIGPFSDKFDAIINSTAFRSLKAFDVDRFDLRMKQFELIEKIPEEYVGQIRLALGSVLAAQNFLNMAKRSAEEFKYYHLKYEMQLVSDDQLEEIKFLEQEMDTLKEGEYLIPEDRKPKVVQRLLSAEVAGRKDVQIKILSRLKQYVPLDTLPISDEKDDGQPRMVDF